MSVCLHPMMASQLSQAPRRSSRLMVSLIVISAPLPPGLGIVISIDYVGRLPVTSRGITDVLAFTNVLIDLCIPLRACPSSVLSDNGLQCGSVFSHAVYKLFGVRKIPTSSHHPSGNGGVERVRPTMAQILAMAVVERHDDWDAQLPNVEFVYNNSVSATSSPTPKEVHIGTLRRLPPAMIVCTGVTGRKSMCCLSISPHIANRRRTINSAPAPSFASSMPSHFFYNLAADGKVKTQADHTSTSSVNLCRA